jgi:hypothetical protein
MGLFKGIKDVVQTERNLKEAAAEHGGVPTIGDTYRDIRGAFDDRGERAILQTGVAAKAIVRGFPQQIPGDRFAMQIPLEIHPPQGQPYTIDYVFPTVRMQAALSPGMEVPVKVDPDNPQDVAVQWDAQKAAIAAAGGSTAAVMDGLSQTYGGAANAAMEQAMKNLRDGTQGALPPTTFAPDLQSRIEQLDRLKAGGLIDEAQYKAKKQKLIDQL